MNTVLDEILRTKTVVDRDGNGFPVHSEIPAGNGEFLQRLVRSVRPRRSLEVGLAYGISSLFICEALAEVGTEVHHAIDPLQFGQGGERDFRYDTAGWDRFSWDPATGWRGIGLLNLERAGFGELVRHHDEPSYLALPELVRDGLRVDFAFVDGWHTFDYVLLDFFYTDLLLDPGGIVAFDDSHNPAIRKVLRYVLSNRRYEVVDDQRVAAGRVSRRRRALRSAVHRWDGVRRSVAPEVVAPDRFLGLPPGRCIALRKLADDVLGDGSDGSRRWNHHVPF